MERTSITDDKSYPMYCYTASKNDVEFSKFKQNPIYRRVLEHVPPEQGKTYLEIVLANTELHLSNQDWEYILKNDSIGDPRMAQYNFGSSQIICSPTTLRYLKVLSDIVKLFPKDILRGGGYVKLV